MLLIPNSGILFDEVNNYYIINTINQDVIDRLVKNIPQATTRVLNNSTLVYLPAEEATIDTMREYGLKTDGMELFYYQYPVPLVEGKYNAMAHQISSAAFMSSRNRCFNTSTMRTGKTGSVILAIDYLQSVKRELGAALIVSTVSSLTGVWQKTIQETLPHKLSVVVHGGSGKQDRLKKLKQDADYYIINYDGIKLVTEELVAMVNNGIISYIILDELTHYGNSKSQRWIAMNKIINGQKPVKYCWGLTGSPGGDSLAVYGYVKLVNPNKIPCQRLTTWKDLVQYRYGREAWQWKDRPEASAIISRVMQPTIRFDKKDIMDLPPVVYQIRDCELTKEQSAAYKQMKSDMITLTQEGTVVEAVNKASLLHKLFQIILGTVISEDQTLHYLNNKNRMDTLIEIIEESSQKVVIFSPYTGVIDRLVRQLSEKYTVAKIDGSVTGRTRTKILQAFQEEKDPHILVCHPETTAFGVELAAADTMIFNGPPLSGGFIYEQALERLSSLKQKAKQISIVQIVATPEERKFFSMLDAGVKNSEAVNNLFLSIIRK